jgi:hypothetical protein
MGRPSMMIAVGVAALAPGSASRARQAVGAGRRGRGGALAAGAVYCSLRFELAGRTHSCGQGLGVLDPDVDAERRLETSVEQLNPLRLGKWTSPREERLEPILILGDHARAPAFSQFGQRGSTQRWPITQVQHPASRNLRYGPEQGALVRLDLDVPHLRAPPPSCGRPSRPSPPP